MLSSALFVIFTIIGVRGQPLGVTLTPVNDCSGLPRYNNATNIAGPWTIRVNGCHNSTSPQGDCNIDGFAASCDIKRSAEEKSFQRGSITISNRPHNAKTKLRCNGALQTLEALVPSGAGALDWHAVGIDRDPSTGEMEWGIGSRNTESVQVYRQYVHGSPVDGLFLGSNGQINWAVHHSGSGLSSVDRRPFWFLRLLSKESRLWKGEYETSIRIDGS